MKLKHEEVVRQLREFRKDNSLRGLNIEEMIQEGRSGESSDLRSLENGKGESENRTDTQNQSRSE